MVDGDNGRGNHDSSACCAVGNPLTIAGVSVPAHVVEVSENLCVNATSQALQMAVSTVQETG